MTANDPTPAEVRGAEALKAASGVTFPWAMSAMPKVLGAALDVEEMARAMRDAECTGHDHGTSACPDRHCRSDTLPKYRKLAEAIRAAQLGEHA